MVLTPSGLTTARAQSLAERGRKRGTDRAQIRDHSTVAMTDAGVLHKQNRAF